MAKWFTTEEMCVSASYPKLVEVPEDGSQIYWNIQYTIERLDRIREEWGSPIIVTSGYRPQKLNKAVGGSRTSAHLTGMAADIHPKKGSIMKLAELIVNMEMDFDQLILEKCTVKNGIVTDCQWLHVGYSRNRNRRQVLAWDGKGYKEVKITRETKFSV